MQIINGRKLSEDILSELKEQVSALDFVPIFCDILVGEDMSSIQYVNLKKKKALDIGIAFHDASFPPNITTNELLLEIEKINNIPNMCGIIMQLPLPGHIDTKAVLGAINPNLDVDCLGDARSQAFYGGSEELVPPTALACMALLESLNIDLSSKKIAVLGNGKLVGRPVSQLLKNRNYSFTTLDRDSLNKLEVIKSAEVIISGIGQGKYVTGSMVAEGVIVIDAGTSEEGGSIVGDVDFESVKEKASYLTPVPGGVGPVTVAMLFRNVLKVAQKMLL